jgi:cysteinyl-tRNA synthetase
MGGISRISVVALVLLAGCSMSSGRQESFGRVERLAEASRWHYQLQNVDPALLAPEGYDVQVIDRLNDEGKPWSRDVIDTLRGEDGQGLVLCYLSIGEAEDYRAYWDEDWTTDPPEWLGPENPEWPGNYPVKFWYPEWLEIIGRDADAAVHAGFDGLYLDRVDAYWYWSAEAEEDDMVEEEFAAAKMIDLVGSLALRARLIDGGDFLIVPQNAALIGDAAPSKAGEYLSMIDAIGVEDVLFSGNLPENNQWHPDLEVIEALDAYQVAGKVVLSVEYLTDPALVQRYLEEANNRGYIPFAALSRELDEK